MFGRAPGLKMPLLTRGSFASGSDGEAIVAWTDEELFERTRVRIAFFERAGGVSPAPCDSLNVIEQDSDNLANVRENHRRLLQAFSIDEGTALVQPKQVHGERVLSLDRASASEVQTFREQAQRGADSLLVKARDVAALFAAADCALLIMVAPSGHFAVVHAGWRGVESGIAVKTLRKLVLAEPGLATDASCINVYRGSYIHAECFEVQPDVHQLFADRFGPSVALDESHIDLGRALDLDLVRAGVNPERIADVGECTVCANDRWFSYRASNGDCGRHGALCVALS